MDPCINNQKSKEEQANGGSSSNETNVQQQQEGMVENSDITEVLEEEPRNLLISLLSELKIGVDLSKVPLPTFILEPRSLLEKFTDFMIHGDLLSGVSQLADPLDRIHQITRWYLSGMYYRPKGVKKPYNPILGEIFRAKWTMNSGSQAFLIAEQISHHPPVSCVYISNRKDGYTISGLINPRSKFLGTSMAVIVEGSVTLTLPQHQEEYVITFPTAYARGILFGTLLTEIAGTTTITCKQSQLKAEMDFKSKPFFGGEYNTMSGKIKKKNETFYSFSGKWDKRIDITNSKQKKSQPEVFWEVAGAKKTPRFIRAIQDQEENESQRLWQKVTQAIINKDQKEATLQKNTLEDEQRKSVKYRKEHSIEWEPKYFKKVGDQWQYKYANQSPYNPSEPIEIEENCIVQFKGASKPNNLNSNNNSSNLLSPCGAGSGEIITSTS